MPKGLISQTVVVLFRKDIELADLRRFLTEFNVVKENAEEHWEFGGPTLILEYLPEVNGLVSIDVVNRPWPDHMGDPKTEFRLFGAWSMGWFGPFTFPDNLQRALQNSWRWPVAKETVSLHRTFVRIRISYVFGAAKDAKCLPENYEPLKELEFITTLASTLLQHPDALCYFNPNGEVLTPKSLLDETVAHAREHNYPPLEIWSNIRLFNLNDEWLLMDTVGNWQLDITDHEIAFAKNKVQPQDIDRWLRNTSLYILNKGNVIKDGETMDGPDKSLWQAKSFSKGMSNPPRRVLRWLPYGENNIPAILLGEKSPTEDIPTQKPKKWKFW